MLGCGFAVTYTINTKRDPQTIVGNFLGPYIKHSGGGVGLEGSLPGALNESSTPHRKTFHTEQTHSKPHVSNSRASQGVRQTSSVGDQQGEG